LTLRAKWILPDRIHLKISKCVRAGCVSSQLYVCARCACKPFFVSSDSKQLLSNRETKVWPIGCPKWEPLRLCDLYSGLQQCLQLHTSAETRMPTHITNTKTHTYKKRPQARRRRIKSASGTDTHTYMHESLDNQKSML
jgi:hypothetical protein